MEITDQILNDAEALYNFHASFCRPPIRSDLILAAGSHDMRVPEQAAALYLQGYASLVVCSGGFGKITDGLFPEPEGVLFARRCMELGVPEDRILIEQEARNTGENFTYSKKLLAEHKFPVKTGLIVCKPYMSARTLATAQKQWSEVDWRVCAPPIPFEKYFREDMPAEQEIQLLTGDLQRLRVYADLGYQVPVDVPEEIWAAFERLVAAGFDRYYIKGSI